jgi:hypothetical protein
MTAKAATAKAGMGNTVADRLRELGVRGVLVQMAQRRQIVELRPQREGSLRPEIPPSRPVGTVAGPLPEAQVRWRSPRPLERPALARALQPRGLWLAHED